MDDVNVPIFSQAKLEYTKQLVDILYMNMYDGVRSIYDDAKVLYIKQRKPITTSFRALLEQVPKWNTEIIDSETERIERASKCDWLDDLLTAVFISHTRILMSIGTNQNFNRINVTIPKTTTFVHKTYINIAREVWKNPYLFDENIPGHEYQRNMKQLEDMIKLTIEDTIRRQLPIKEILREHLENYDEPKQPVQQLDMKALVDELRKAGLRESQSETATNDTETNDTETNDTETNDTETNDNDDEENDTDSNDVDDKPAFASIFNKEEELEQPKPDDYSEPQTNTMVADTMNSDTTSNTSSNVFEYNDPEDPTEDQIKAATENIVLNDITEPVVEEKYDNVELVSPKKADDTSGEKLNSMIKELSMGTEKDAKKKENEKITSVVKIDPMPEPVKAPEPEPVKAPDPEPVKVSEPVSVKSPFSFDSLYPGLGKGIVEEPKPQPEPEPEPGPEPEPKPKPNATIVIKEDKSIPEQTKDINADVMKEVISLDKKQEEIEETQTLDNFFTDVQKLANPAMEPIKEESKYTLFEDASDKE
jgi:hypothetical protein